MGTRGGGNGMASARDSDSDSRAISQGSKMRTGGRFEKHKATLLNMSGGVFSKGVTHWDVAPGKEYFDELFRVSKNQYIWGGNYFELPGTRGFLIWEKLSISAAFSMAMCEYAWMSINANAKIFKHAPQGEKGDKRFHPTQKPVALYAWILENYAKPGWKLLDTHGGSCSSGIAAHNAGYDMDICELDAGYYAAAKERLERHQMQQQLPFTQAVVEEPKLFGETQ